jgi:FtsP/CotA-like multicopper oxidase with cupredoxin domain
MPPVRISAGVPERGSGMVKRILVLAVLFGPMVALSTVPAHDGEKSHEGSMEMSDRGVASPAVGDDGYQRAATPAGFDAVVGRSNPLRELDPEIITDGEGRTVKVFRLTVEDVKFEIHPGKTVEGWGFNGLVPGPVIRVREGDRLRIVMTNKTRDESEHTVHVHGQRKPLTEDGVPYIGQKPVKKGETYTIEFTASDTGTSWYHCHVDSAHHVDMGMYGPFIVEPTEEVYPADREYVLVLDEWPTGHKHVHEGTMPAEGHGGGEHGVVTEHKGVPRHEGKEAPGHEEEMKMKPPSDMETAEKKPAEKGERDWYPTTHKAYKPVYDTFTINGRSFPYTEPLEVREGEKVKIRIINAGYEPHFIHTHSHKFLVVARDGTPVETPQKLDTVQVGPGQRVDILLTADNPGVWPLHCHRLTHVANDHIYPGGMMTVIRYVD